MATSTITGTITDPAGTDLANVRVVCRLLPRPCFETATGVELAPVVETVTNASGVYTLTLVRTVDITPSNSYYEITEYIPDRYGGPVKHVIQVGASNQSVLAALVTTPPSPSAAVYLTQTAGDARYQQLAGYGTSSDVADSRPNDDAAAGVSSSAARADHKHERETTYGTAAERAALTGTDLYEGLTFRETDSTDKLYTYRNADWLQQQDTIVCTSSTRPSNPYQGMWIYETDTGNVLVYYGSTTGWRPPWTLPWGFIATVAITSDSGTATSIADVSGLSLSVPQVLNRRYEIMVKGELVFSVADGAAVWALTDGSNTVLDRYTFPGLSTSSMTQSWSYFEVAASTTTVTRKLRQQKASGTGNVRVGASASAPAYILVKDVGPSGTAPAS